MMIEIDALLDSAFENFNQKKYEMAETLARQVQSVVPTHGDALYLLGLIAFEKNILTQACDYLTVATRLYPKQKAYQLALADVFLKLKNFESAKKIYEFFPESDELNLKKAWLEKEKGNDKKALMLFKGLLKTSQKAEALYGLSFLHSGKEKLNDLLASFKISPCEKTAQAIVEILINKKETKKITNYLPYISDEFLLAKIDFVFGQKIRAKERLKAFLKNQPYHVLAWTLLGKIQLENKEEKEAEFSFNQALSIEKNSYEAHKCLARLMMIQSRFSEALDHYQVICRMNPEDKETLMAMALLAEKTHNYSESLGLYFRLLTLGVKNLNSVIKKNIQMLAETDKKLALDFLKGWQKAYPKNKVAKAMKIVILFFALLLPVSAFPELSQDEENWRILWEGKMAEAGDVESQIYVAELFEKGKNVPKNILKAVQYYEKAAYQGSVEAAMRLGGIFSNEENGPLYNEEKSLKWYQFAAQKGDIQAQYYLANFYQERKHLDLNQAKEYLEKALKQTFPNESDLTKVSPQYEILLEKTKTQKNNILNERKLK